jgi:hypothetical protein
VLEVLAKWLGEEAARSEAFSNSPAILSLLKILSILPLTVDLLVHYKYGRVIKKIIKAQPKAAAAPIAVEIHALAERLFDRWTEMALDAERLEQEALAQQARAQPQTPMQAQTSIQAQMQAQGPAGDSVISAESIGQKRRADSEGSLEDLAEAPKKQSRHVRFPSDPASLAEVIEFHRDPHEWEYLGVPTANSINAAVHDMMYADRDEAAIAFKQFHELESEDIEEEKLFEVLLKWSLPLPIAGIPENLPAGNESEERNAQAQRERTVLSVAFYTRAEIPESLTEPLPVSHPPSQAKIIPFWDPATDTLLVQKSVRFGLRNDVSYGTSPSIPTKDLPGNVPVLDTALLASFFNSPPAFPSSLASNLEMYSSHSSPMSRKPSYPSLPNPASPNQTHAPFKKARCRFYRSGQPGSCRFGDSCTFLHQDD